MPERRVAVVGCGNILMRDDGVGVRAVERLRERGVAEGVELIDAGTALMDVLPFLGGVDKTILVDAVRAGGEPGAVYRMPLAELENTARRPGGAASLHDIELREALTLARLENADLGEVVVIGMEPGPIETGMELSEPVERAVPRLIEAIRNEIGQTKE